MYSFCGTSDIEFELGIIPTCLLLIVLGKNFHNRLIAALKQSLLFSTHRNFRLLFNAAISTVMEQAHGSRPVLQCGENKSMSSASMSTDSLLVWIGTFEFDLHNRDFVISTLNIEAKARQFDQQNQVGV